MLPKNCIRIDANRLQISGDIPATIFANEQVSIEDAAVDELNDLLELERTTEMVYALEPHLFSEPPHVERVSLSPDFHKGAGIPIGTTMKTRGFCVPQAVGNDINCGVRLHDIQFDKDTIVSHLDELEHKLRHIFFEGGRNIPLSKTDRYDILCGGYVGFLSGFNYPKEGIWNYFDEEQSKKDIFRAKHHASFNTSGNIWGLDDYVNREGISRDSQVGSIGGGNHFVEIQYVHKILDGSAAYHIGLKKNHAVLMVHSGSVSVGHLCGEAYKDLVKSIYPKKLGFPVNGIFPLPDKHPARDKFFTALKNAANFAFFNRMCLALMVKQALSEVIGDHQSSLIYDSPHNLVWEQDDGSFLHRKGACPAGGIGEGAVPYFGEVVLVPGSMGASSYVMEGQGNPEALGTASHGAGRQLSRGDALHQDDAAFDQFLKEYRVVTPVDPKRQDIKNRPDILKKWRENLKKEAPFAYKPINPIIDTLKDAGVAKPIAELRPLLTLKG